MHIPDAVLEDPKVLLSTGILAACGLSYSLNRLKHQLRDRTTVLMGIMSACVFAAQMVKFPLWPAPVAGHLLGGVLAAVLLGPWAGACVIATVLIVQCLLCGDGGLLALGANFVNMGVIGSMIGYAIYAPIRNAIGGRKGILIGAMAAAWFSVILSAGAFAVEFAASGRFDMFLPVLSWMVLVHAGIGIGEALITGLVIRYVLQVRPDFIYQADIEPTASSRRWGQVAIAGLGMSLAVALFLAPVASELPDGLEMVGAKFGFIDESKSSAPVIKPILPDYQIVGLERWKGVSTALAGAVGTLVVFGFGLGLARSFTVEPELSTRVKGAAPDAA
jgi:cobalt/nickel transport system permease protein